MLRIHLGVLLVPPMLLASAVTAAEGGAGLLVHRTVAGTWQRGKVSLLIALR
jgi:hypothetical protein